MTIATAHKKSLKKTYKYLNKKQYKIIKLIEKKELIEKYFYAPLSGFYKRAPRENNGVINWEKLSNSDIDLFEYQTKEFEKINKVLDKFSEIEILETKNLFKMTQFSFSQSF